MMKRIRTSRSSIKNFLSLGQVRSISGVVTQGRADSSQWVKSYWLEVTLRTPNPKPL